MHRRLILAATATVLATAISLPAAAQGSWPTKQVHIVVPTGPGSSLDLIVRLMSDKLAAKWGQTVVVDNKPGAGGMIGLDVAAKSTDNHTIAIGFNGPVAYAHFLYRKTPYDPLKDLRPIIMTTSQPNVLAVSVDKVPAKNMAEFITWAKAQGDKLNYSSLGNGSSAHLTMELFLSETGLKATHIPYNGSPPAAMAVAQGNADVTFMVAPALLPHVQNNKVRMLAVSSAQRPDSLKSLPTLADSGYPKVESLAWNGLVGPASMPDAIVNQINADANVVLKDEAIVSAMAKSGLTVMGGSPADFKKVIDADAQRWGTIITKLGVKLD